MNWRGSPKPKGNGPPESRNERRQVWRPEAESRKGTGAGRLWTKRLAGTAAFVGLAALVGWMLTWPGCVRSRFRTFVVSDYVRDLPPNPHALADGALLRGLDEDGGREPLPLSLGDLGERLASPGYRANEVLVLYVNVLGGPLGARFRLIPADGDVDDVERFPPLDELWTLLRERVPARTHKVLLLDVSRPDFDPRLGLLENDVVAQIRRELEAGAADGTEPHRAGAASVENLHVLLACDEGERSWTGTRLGSGRSSFAHFAAEAFRTGPAGADANRDGIVDLDEFAAFVGRRTDEWCIQNRDPAGQHPLLLRLPTADRNVAGLRLRNVVETLPAAADPPDGRSAREACDTWWSRLEEPAVRTRIAADPLLARSIEFGLLHGEDLLEAQRPAEVEDRLRRIDEAVRALVPFDAEEAASATPFARAHVGRRIAGREPPEKDEANVPRGPTRQWLAVADAFGRRSPGAAVVAAPLREQAAALREKAERAACGPLGTLPWTRPFVEEGDRRRRAYEDGLFVSAAASARDAAASPVDRTAAEEAYDEALRISGLVAGARAALDDVLDHLPGLLDWSAARTPAPGDADRARRWESPLRKAVVEKYLDRLERGGRELPEPAEIRASAAKVADRSDVEVVEVEILAAARSAHRLSEQLELPALSAFLAASAEGKRERLERLKTSADESRAALERIRAGLESRAAELRAVPPAQAQASYRREVEDLLRWPHLSAESRRELRRRATDVERRLAERTVFDRQGQDDRTDPKSAVDVRGGDPDDGKSDRGGDSDRSAQGVPPERAEWRALCVVHALTLGATSGPIAESEKSLELWKSWLELGRLSRRADDPELRRRHVAVLGDQIRGAFLARRRFVEETKSRLGASLADDRARLEEAARTARSLHGHDAGLVRRGHDPQRDLADFLLAEVLAFQARRLTDDFYAGGDATVSGAGSEHWFAEVSRQCLRAAERIVEPHASSYGHLVAEIESAGRHVELRRRAALQVRATDPRVHFGANDRRTAMLSVAADAGVPAGRSVVWIGGGRAADPEAPVQIEAGPAAGVSHSTKAPVEVAFDLLRRTTDPNRPLIPECGTAARDAACREAKFESALFFRGHRASNPGRDLVAVPCPPCGPRWRYVPTAGPATIVVRGVDRRDLVFVVDCSLSMDEPLTTPDGPVPRHRVARQELWNAIAAIARPVDERREVQNVALVRFGGTVTMERFRRADGGFDFTHFRYSDGKSSKDEPPNNPNPKQPPKGRPEPNTDVQWFDWTTFEFTTEPLRSEDRKFGDILSGARIGPKQAVTAFHQLRDVVFDRRFDNPPGSDPLRPFGTTPLGRAILAGIGQLEVNHPQPAQQRGGVVVVVTDGQSTEGRLVTGERDLYPGLLAEIRQQLQGIAARSLEAEVHVAGFAVVPQDKAELRKIEDQTGGLVRFHDAPDAAALSKVLADIRPRPYQVDRLEPRPLGEATTSVLPGEHRIAFPNAEPVGATIVGGERLEFVLDSARRRLLLLPYPDPTEDKRFLSRFSEFVVPRSWPAPADPSGAADPSRLVLRRFRSQFRTNELSTAELDLSLDHVDATHAVRPPAEVWFEVAPRDLPGHVGLSTRFERVAQQCVPTWRVALEQDFPRDRAAVVRAWWKRTRTPVESSVLLGEIDGVRWTVAELRLPEERILPLRIRRRGNAESLRFEIQPAAEESTPGFREQSEALRGLRIELGSGTGARFAALETGVEIEAVVDSDGRGLAALDVRFESPPAGSAEPTCVGLTTLASRKLGAAELKEPLVATAPD